jgi:hypothetical protein
MSGDKIYCILRDNNLSDNHFDGYAEYIRKRDNPTPEEITERQEKQRRLQEAQEESRRLYEEKQRVTNQYKASSRLERLKAKNNIS